eukprot:m.159802 g.159802  ORF g.159802 m.159802 type:complete len:288 (-) comp15159_c0_seq4:2346-3209(-)
MDRIQEFHSVAEMLAMRGGGVGPAASPRPEIEANMQDKFMEITKKLYGDITTSESKLEKLGLLFEISDASNDKSAEIHKLVGILNQDIRVMHATIQKLNTQVQQRLSRRVSRECTGHLNGIIKALNLKLGGVSEGFKNFLKQHENLLTSPKPNPSPSGPQHNELRSRAPKSGRAGDAAVALDIPQQTDMLMDHDEQKRRERDEMMNRVQKTIEELAGIFTQLGTLVADQGQDLMRIEDDIMATADNVQGAHTEVSKYYRSLVSNRGLMLRVFLGLLLFFTFFVYIRS